MWISMALCRNKHVSNAGDVQPYLALGKRLRQYGHTVRLTTHETFRQSVKEAGLRFFNIDGDPREPTSHMVRNPGLLPGFESLTNNDMIRKQRIVGEVRAPIFTFSQVFNQVKQRLDA